MLGAALLWCALALVLAEALQDQPGFSQENFAAYTLPPSPAHYKATCEKIAESISSASQVFYPDSQEFELDISHWASSSSQVPVCSVEPGTPDDVASILQQIARARVPFAVKGGGHNANPGFSSTPGVHISMTRLNHIVISKDSRTVEIGAGLTWADVYAYLVPKGFNVVGGRMNGVGVAGLTLGGGYSWKSNEHGLTVDTVTEFHLVSPNGTEIVVTEADEDLWFALKGGFNNYGIVTKFTLKLYPQTNVWGASLIFEGELADPAAEAFVRFLSWPHDHKASQMGRFMYSNGSVSFGLSLFYDGPEPPMGLYDELLSLTYTTTTISQGTFTDFMSTQILPTYNRVRVNGIPMLHYTEHIMKAYANETKFWGDRLSQYDDNMLLFYVLEPFEPDFLTHGKPSAYPPDRSLAVLPSLVYVGWTSSSTDVYMADAAHRSAASLVEAAIQDGQDLKNAGPYVNYAIFGTPLERMYGKHLERLREIRKKYDPENVMGLTGGWKF
ncbi:FAD-binding domain-containing protein [Russula ochroleuca]|uniref:FAD-binding domain-containing protein n=1 Tax=Russula ochroleuca TaxID=152965 RepID=A0A9P5JVM4_9AGAM|nr:FAD-binding domain-containing protein [Russula ochroleuca]